MKTGKKPPLKTGIERCAACDSAQKSAASGPENLCAHCRKIVTLFRENPSCGIKIIECAGIPVPSPLQPKQVEQELPDVLDAVRYRTIDRERNTWYVSVSELEGNPVEIFASTAFDRDQHLQSRISNLTTITRLISLILRHIFLGERLTLEKTLTQLDRSSRLPDDLPAMLGKVLANYHKKKSTEAEKDPAIP